MKNALFYSLIIISIASSTLAFAAEDPLPPAWLTGVETPETKSVAAPAKSGPTEFIDVPQAHWASSAVYDLVKMGITQGYPDGTYRGGRSINRHETALFLSRMSDYVKLLSKDASERSKKDFKENYEPKLRAELAEIRKEIELMRNPETVRPEFGYILGKVKIANFTSIGSIGGTNEVNTGPRFDYRAKLTFKGWVNPSVWAEANFDTMDAGWGGVNHRDLAVEMLDLSARVKSPWKFDFLLSAGPGMVVHNEPSGSAFPSDDGIAFLRPRNSIGGEGKVFGADWHASYSSLLTTSTGESVYDSYKLRLAYAFDEDRSVFGLSELAGTMYVDQATGGAPGNSAKEVLSLSLKPKWGFEFMAAGGISAVPTDTGNNFYYETAIKFKDLPRKGMLFDLSAIRIGSEYINFPNYLAEESILGVDPLDKLNYLPGGGAKISMKLSFDASEYYRLYARGALALNNEMSYGADKPGSYASFDFAVDYLTEEHSSFGLLYRIYHEPSYDLMPVSDLIELTAKYEF